MNCIKIGLPGKLILGDFPKTFSLTENQFSGKTYFYTIVSRGPSKSARRSAATRATPGTGSATGKKGRGRRSIRTMFATRLNPMNPMNPMNLNPMRLNPNDTDNEIK